jgi:hypothetical protein
MPQLLIKFLLIAFLFGSVEAAVDSVQIDNDHAQDSQHLVHDHDKSNNSDLEDDCEHHCHCAGQTGLTFSSSVKSVQTSVIVKISDTHSYRSNFSPPLFRPPIY